MGADLSDNYLVRVGVDDQVGVVRDHDHLAPAFCSQKQGYELIIDGFRVEVLFWLIDNQRAIFRVIERKIEQYQNDPPRTG